MPDKEAILMVGNAYIQNGNVIEANRQTAENFDITYMDIEEFIAKYDRG
jgi:hypothetical protein